MAHTVLQSQTTYSEIARIPKSASIHNYSIIGSKKIALPNSDSGLTAYYVDNPVITPDNNEEDPGMTIDDLMKVLRDSCVIRGTVKDISCIRADSGDTTYYITVFTVEVGSVLNGNVDTRSVRIAGARSYTNVEPSGQFPMDETLAASEIGDEGIFVIGKVTEQSTWRFGSKELAVRDLGDYFFRKSFIQDDGGIICNESALISGIGTDLDSLENYFRATGGF